MQQNESPEVQKFRKYTALAISHVKMKGMGTKDNPAPVIVPETPEWEAWKRYFREVWGLTPIVMILAEKKQTKESCFTVPEQWPEWFDATSQKSDSNLRARTDTQAA